MFTHYNSPLYHHCSFGCTIGSYVPKTYLKHFVLEVLVGDLGVEVEDLSLETLW